MTVRTVRLTTAQALVKFLNAQYLQVDGVEFPFVEGVFTIFGHGNVLGIGQALEQDPGHLKLFQGKSEQGMAHAAVAYSRQMLRRKIYAVTTSIGPGSANLVTAAATAMANNIPVLLLPADTFATRQPDPVLQQLEQESSAAITTNDALAPVSRYWDRVLRPEQLMPSLVRAFEVLTNPATGGPATVCIAQDVQGEAYDFDEAWFEKRVHYLDRKEPTARELEGAITLIRESQKPVFLVGGGAKYSEASDILRALSEKHHIPIVETQAGKSTVSSLFENNLGGVGVTGTRMANQIARDADLVIGIGTRYTDFSTASKTAFDWDRAKVLNINVSRMQTYKLDGFSVVADAKATLERIGAELGDYQSQFGDRVREVREAWMAERDRLANVAFSTEGFDPEVKNHFPQSVLNEYAEAFEHAMPQTTALIAINDAVPEDAVVIGASGSLPGDMERLWHSSVFNTYHMEYGYSCMGYEVSGALGMKLAHPDQEVYAMVGDGSFLMLHSELVTAIQTGHKINVILFDNAGFGCISNLQMGHGSAGFLTEFRTHDNQVMNIDYAKIGEAYGAKAYKVRNVDELRAALDDARSQRRSTLIEMKVFPKTMTDGYDSWWNVGVAAVSDNPLTQQQHADRLERLKSAKQH